jgi:YaiO family outer membrane protein
MIVKLLFLLIAACSFVNPLSSQPLDMHKNKVVLFYSADAFSEGFAPWNFAYLEYQRKFGSLTLIGRINYQHRFRTDAYQYEIDAYPKFAKGFYAYLNAAYSNHSLFPEYRFGAEAFKSAASGFEFSLGFRFIKGTTKGVWIYTGSVSKYYPDYWASLRAYVSFRNKKTYPSLSFSLRRYIGIPDNYLTVRISAGFHAAERRTFQPDENLYSLKSHGVGIDLQHKIYRDLFGKASFDWEREEYFEGRFRNRWSVGIGLALLL